MTTPESQQAADKPCPFCRSDRIEYEHYPRCFAGQKYPGYSTDDGYRIRCHDCGCQTCWWHTEAEALTAWNQRTPAPVDVSHAALAERAKWLRRYSPKTLPIYHEIAAEIEAAIRAHPAGGVSEEQALEWLRDANVSPGLERALVRQEWKDGIDIDVPTHDLMSLFRTALRAAGIGAGVVSDRAVESACYSFRHDFGLLSDEEQRLVRHEARKWLYAWQKELSPHAGKSE